MFTGLVTELGKVVDISRRESSAIFTIAAPALIKSLFRLKNVDAGETVASKGWNG